MSRYTFPVTLSSAKKNGPNTRINYRRISAKRMYEENNYFAVYLTEFVFISVEVA